VSCELLREKSEGLREKSGKIILNFKKKAEASKMLCLFSLLIINL